MPRAPSEIWALIWGDATPTEKARTLRIVFRAAVLFHVAGACGWIPGWAGFARAADVDDKIRAAVDPINQKLDTLAAVTNRILIEQVASRLRDLQRLRCATTDAAAVDRLDAEIESAGREYRQLTGERYLLPACVP